MTASPTSMSLLIREQIPRDIVEAPSGQTASATDAEARRVATAIGRGDEAAFRALYERYHQRVFRFALVLGHGDESLAREMVQSVFLVAAKKLRRADSEEHLWNWLARVARQQLAKKWRTHLRDAAIISVEELPENYPAAADVDSVLEEILDAALNAMEAEERQLIEAFYFDNLSQKELAERLGTTPKAVSSRLERAREKLRAAIKRKLSYES